MNRFPDEVLASLDKGKILGIRAGSRPHRIIGIWVVVVARRVFVDGSSGDNRTAMTDIAVVSSSIEGLGIFAAQPFRAGDRVTRVRIVREITPEAPIRTDLGERLDHCAYPDGRVVLIAFPERHVNHSCQPNAYERYERTGSDLVALRDIAIGEEITIDYNINIANGTAWPCRCGAGRCRGKVAGDFFLLPPEWQREYRPLLAEWFVARHRGRIEALDTLCREA